MRRPCQLAGIFVFNLVMFHNITLGNKPVVPVESNNTRKLNIIIKKLSFLGFLNIDIKEKIKEIRDPNIPKSTRIIKSESNLCITSSITSAT